MAIALDTVSEDNGSGSSLTISHTCSADTTKLVVGVACIDSNDVNRPVTGITYNGVALTKIDSSDTGAGTSESAELWYLDSPATGSAHDCVVSTTGTVQILAGVISLEGTDTGVDASNTSNGSSSDSECAVTTVAANCWVVDALGSEPNVTSENEMGTIRWEQDPQTYQTGAGATSGPHAASTAVTHGYAHAYGARWRMVIASFAPAAAPTGIASLRQLVGHGQGTR